MSEASKPESSGPSPHGLGILSVFLFAHLCCVVIALFSNQYASVMQLRLIRTISPYTRTFGFDPLFVARFHLTHALDLEDDHQIQVENPAGEVIAAWPTSELGSMGWRGGFRFQRWKNLSQRMATYVVAENDSAIAELMQDVGRLTMSQFDESRFVVRLRRRPPLELNRQVATSDINRPAELEDVYVADVFRDEAGSIRVHKRVDTGEAAPLQSNP